MGDNNLEKALLRMNTSFSLTGHKQKAGPLLSGLQDSETLRLRSVWVNELYDILKEAIITGAIENEHSKKEIFRFYWYLINPDTKTQYPVSGKDIANCINLMDIILPELS